MLSIYWNYSNNTEKPDELQLFSSLVTIKIISSSFFEPDEKA